MTLHGLSPPRCINGYLQHNAGGNPLMDWHPIQGKVAILLVALCYSNQIKGKMNQYRHFLFKLLNVTEHLKKPLSSKLTQKFSSLSL